MSLPSQLNETLMNLPSWAGSVPLWALLGTVVIALIKVWPSLKQLDQTSEAAIRKELRERVEELKGDCKRATDAIRECQENCDKETNALREQMLGMRRQHVQEQISFARAIIDSIPESGQLKVVLNALEAGERALKEVQILPPSEEQNNEPERP